MLGGQTQIASDVTLLGLAALVVADRLAVAAFGGHARASGQDRGTLMATNVATIAAFGVALAATLTGIAPLPGPAPLWLALGFALTACGITLRVWSIRTLGRFFVRVVQVDDGHQLVRSGPYAVLRHPSYAGVLLAYAGLGISMGNAISTASLAALPAVGYLWRIRVEEDALRVALGVEYEAYASSTYRLIPGVW